MTRPRPRRPSSRRLATSLLLFALLASSAHAGTRPRPPPAAPVLPGVLAPQLCETFAAAALARDLDPAALRALEAQRFHPSPQVAALASTFLARLHAMFAVPVEWSPLPGPESPPPVQGLAAELRCNYRVCLEAGGLSQRLRDYFRRRAEHAQPRIARLAAWMLARVEAAVEAPLD